MEPPTPAITNVLTSTGRAIAYHATQDRWVAVGDGANTLASSSGVGSVWAPVAPAIFTNPGRDISCQPSLVLTSLVTIGQVDLEMDGTLVVAPGGGFVMSQGRGMLIVNGNVTLGGTLRIAATASGVFQFLRSTSTVSGTFASVEIVGSSCTTTGVSTLSVTVTCQPSNLSPGVIAGIAIAALAGGVALALAVWRVSVVRMRHFEARAKSALRKETIEADLRRPVM